MTPDILLVGTYHKTGTVWMQRVFRNLGKSLDLSFVGSDLSAQSLRPEPGFYLDDHSRFPDTLLDAEHSGLRMIRDPRDVVISGAHYHVRSDESWLHIPREDMDGMSYQQAIIAQDTPLEKYLFEMRNIALQTCDDMIEGISKLPGFATVQYETWMTDVHMIDFERTMKRLGFSGEALDKAKETFFQFSLFGESKYVDAHTRSGKVQQWRDLYTRSLGEAFLEIYGDALITLGYEKNHDWVLGLSQ